MGWHLLRLTGVGPGACAARPVVTLPIACAVATALGRIATIVAAWRPAAALRMVRSMGFCCGFGWLRRLGDVVLIGIVVDFGVVNAR